MKQVKNQTIIYETDEQKAVSRAYAEEMGVSVNIVFREAMRYFLEHEAKAVYPPDVRDDDKMRLVARNLKRYRKIKGLSQAELASLAGYTNQGIVSDIERRRKKTLREETLLKFAQALEVSVEQLLS